ncbi:MAG TPA: DEAD/DEAH box helicase [Candidatus Saccharimonadales bacterium]|nr:DEAD/DEAH box helicase [Candidatus Saccharimonadales bacterium]
MTVEFSDFNLHPALMQALTELGYTTPTPIQSGMIPLMLSGVDVIGQAQPGTGKTAAFALPILHNYQPRQTPQALVLAPTRELALQVAEAIKGYGRHLRVQVLAVYGGQGFGQQIKELRRGVDIVVGTPGRLLDLLNRNILDLSGIKTVVLDEADEMLKMGFIDDVEAILAKTPPARQTALFSATVPVPIRRLADKYMRAPQSVTIQRGQVTAVAIEQRYYLVRPSDKVAALTRILEHEDVKRGLIFARTRIGTAELATALTRQGFPAETLNGDLTQEARERVLNRFRNNQIQILVATDVAARGLDIDDISHVFNHDLPSEVEVYVHRIGRTGRASKTGIAISIITPADHAHLRRIEAFTRQKFLRATLPSVEDIMKRRSAQLTEQVTVWLKRGRINRERAIVDELVALGHDPLDVAAAALKLARGDEKQRTIAPVVAVEEMKEEPRNRFQREPRRGAYRADKAPSSRHSFSRASSKPALRNRGDKDSHETGMVRLTLDVGKSHGIGASDLVGTIAYHADIPGNAIGKIRIENQKSFVDVPGGLVSQVMKQAGKYKIRKQVVNVSLG